MTMVMWMPEEFWRPALQGRNQISEQGVTQDMARIHPYAMGPHLDFLVFAGTDKDGHPIADPKRDGTLTVHLADIPLEYRLPLGSLLPPSTPRRVLRFPVTITSIPTPGANSYPGPSPRPKHPRRNRDGAHARKPQRAHPAARLHAIPGARLRVDS
jgi:hypothetical protein